MPWKTGSLVSLIAASLAAAGPGAPETVRAEWMPFAEQALLERFDRDGDGRLDADERQAVREAFGGIDVPAVPWPPVDYRHADWPEHFERAGVAELDNTPPDNPLTNEGATLGRVLFYDRQLSRNRSISCASCHQQQFSFTDPRRFSVGLEGAETHRNSMSLVNLRYTNFRGRSAGFFWDERAATLEEQVLMPIQDKVEMGMELDELERRLEQLPYYSPLFEAAFGSPEVTRTRIARALAQFLRAIVSTRTRFDAAAARAPNLSVDFPEFTAEENLGKRLFIDGPGGTVEFACAMCHEPPTFNMAEAQNIGLELEYSDPGLGALDVPLRDPFAVSNDGMFKASSLRNVELTAPYMHDGRFESLDEVLEHYTRGVAPHPNLNLAFIEPADGGGLGFGFTDEERAALVALLKTLTDKSLLTDERFSDPFLE